MSLESSVERLRRIKTVSELERELDDQQFDFAALFRERDIEGRCFLHYLVIVLPPAVLDALFNRIDDVTVQQALQFKDKRKVSPLEMVIDSPRYAEVVLRVASAETFYNVFKELAETYQPIADASPNPILKNIYEIVGWFSPFVYLRNALAANSEAAILNQLWDFSHFIRLYTNSLSRSLEVTKLK